MQTDILSIERQNHLPNSFKVWYIVMQSSFQYSRKDIVLSYIFWIHLKFSKIWAKGRRELGWAKFAQNTHLQCIFDNKSKNIYK